jgi:hypothetical protein
MERLTLDELFAQVKTETLEEISRLRASPKDNGRRMIGVVSALGRVASVAEGNGFDEDLQQELVQAAASILEWALAIQDGGA